eukprot:m.70755 g.70755  ORF g.70755 m.70755 type:complete len:67 (-) comp8664_c1_seq1:253-453(-)
MFSGLSHTVHKTEARFGAGVKKVIIDAFQSALNVRMPYAVVTQSTSVSVRPRHTPAGPTVMTVVVS